MVVPLCRKFRCRILSLALLKGVPILFGVNLGVPWAAVEHGPDGDRFFSLTF